VDVKQSAVENLRSQLRGSNQYFWEGPAEAADYCLSSKTDLDQGLKWAEQSIQAEDRFENEMTKSQLLAAMDRAPEAAKAHERALEMANPLQLYQYARRLQIQEKKQDEAMAVFRTVVQRSPDGLAGHMAQGRLYSAAGNFEGALKEVKAAQALPGNSTAQVKALDPLIQRLQNKEDINR
jgi:tetratricopeptide (TPR) repeat protein